MWLKKLCVHKILIISYTFPPAEGIGGRSIRYTKGGRRWAKFAKYFVQLGHTVHVISFKSNNKTSSWYSDTLTYQHQITRLSSKYPEILSKNPSTWYQKVQYRLGLWYAKMNTQGNYYDKGAYWGKEFLQVVEEKIQQGFTHVIVTVAPFSIAYTLTRIIHKYPHVQFVVDFRDPWVNNLTSYGYELLSEKRKIFEKKAEETVVRSFHKIVSVSGQMNEYFKQAYQVPETKFLTIHNGFDPDDYHNVPPIPVLPVKDYIECIFTGTFYKKANHIMDKFLEALDVLKVSSPADYHRLRFLFYGTFDFNTKQVMQKYEYVKFYSPKPRNVIYEKIQQADCCMLFLTDDIPYSFSTKFAEYLYFKKPMLVFSGQGFTPEYVEQHQIGMHVHTQHIYEDLKKIVEKVSHKTLWFNQSFANDEFNVKVLAEKYLKLLLDKKQN